MYIEFIDGDLPSCYNKRIVFDSISKEHDNSNLEPYVVAKMIKEKFSL